MKNLIKIIAIVLFSQLILSDLNAQNTFPTCLGCNVGIGTITPTFSLDVNGGDINLSSLNSYRINGVAVLHHNGNSTNIFVGALAGNTNAILDNTFVGYNAGRVNGTTLSGLSGGYENTFVGHYSGYTNDEGFQNTFIGKSAGFLNKDGYHNTFIGERAGYSNVDANSSVYIGNEAGYSNNSQYNVMVGRNAGRFNLGGGNCFYGKDAGYYDQGNDNCYYGFHSGGNMDDLASTTSKNAFYGFRTGHKFYDGEYNCVFGGDAGIIFQEGDSNIFIGGKAQPNAILVNNAVAIGFETQVNADNMFILGNNLHNVGIGLSDDLTFNGPRSKLEINSALTTVDGQSTGSGLQFRQLTSGSALNGDTYFAPYGKVLTVDADGKVKLTDGSGAPFAECGSAPSLQNNISTFLNDNKIYYEGNNTTTGISGDLINSIGIGYHCDDLLKAKLSVYQKAALLDGEETTAGYFHNESEDYGGSGNYKRGLWAISNGYSAAQFNIAGDFSADSSSTVNIAVQGYAGSQANDLFTSVNYGGAFSADYAYQNIGIDAWVGGNGSRNFALQLNAPMGACTTGSCTDGAAYVNGDVYQAGGAYYTTSDRALKKNIQPLQNPLAVIKSLEPKSYNFRTNEFPYLSLSSGTQDGLIAQDLENILPNLVKMYSVPSRTTRSGIDSSGAG